jgi:SulP family sulfate permease
MIRIGGLSMPRPASAAVPQAALSAAAVTIPHALGLGLIAYAPLQASGLPVGALALWSAALPGALAALSAPRAGVVYAPTTVVALLYAAIVASIAASAPALGMGAAQVLAACGLTVAMAFLFQWLFGVLRLASLARFLPISVMHGFAAGVGLSMLLGQMRGGFGAGAGWHWDARLLLHAAAALAVVGIARLSQRRWPRWPGLLPGAITVAAALWLLGLGPQMTPAAAPAPFALPPTPDYGGVPLLALAERHGMHLLSLALLMALVNSLDVLVFNQELDLEHGLRQDPNKALRRESLVGVLCGLIGLIPASTSASRTRIMLSQAPPSAVAGASHAGIMLAVAATGHWWLHWVPMACLAGALLLAGFMQIPAALWSRGYARAAAASWSQSWLVALVFSAAGGAGALMAGLVVATFVLLHASASTALRRWHLDGQVRSRRLRRASSEAWLAPRMGRVAVIELQGVMSFGVAAHMAEQVRRLLQPRHDRVILDAHRVAAWDATALVQLKALGRDLLQEGRQVAVAGLGERAAAQVPQPTPLFADLDRALEWAEAGILEERPPAARPGDSEHDPLGELGEGLEGAARAALEQAMEPVELAGGACLFAAGDAQRELFVVRSGLVTMGTAWPTARGLRLATIGQGMLFGEMAFLNGQPRTASAGAEAGAATLMRLDRAAFDAWARRYPQEALLVMGNLALTGTRRLAATTRQLRAVLE